MLAVDGGTAGGTNGELAVWVVVVEGEHDLGIRSLHKCIVKEIANINRIQGYQHATRLARAGRTRGGTSQTKSNKINDSPVRFL